MTIRADALVLGAGPGGLAAALRLSDRGVHVAVIEARGAAATRPNIVSLTKPSLRTIERLGAADVFVGREAPGAGTGTQATISLSALENRLRAEAARRGIPVNYDTRVAGLVANGGDGATLALTDGRTAAGRFVLNASGGRSGIEEPLGMGLQFAPDWTWYVGARTPFLPDRPSGEIIHAAIGRTSAPGFTPRGESTTVLTVHDVPDEVARFAGYRWMGLQNPIDGFSTFSSIASSDIHRFGLDGIAERALAPAREVGERGFIDPPRLLRLQSAGVEHLRVGSVLALGDAAGRAHPVNMRGTQLAIADGFRGADAVADALADPVRADDALGRYEAATHATHSFFGWDGSKRSGDYFPDAGDVLDLPIPAG